MDIKEPTNMHEFIHGIYLLTRRAYKNGVIEFAMVSSVMTVVMRAHDWSWKVIGITPEALAIFKANGWRWVANCGIERAHLTDRCVMVRHILDGDIPMTLDELMDYWITNDRAVLATKKENRYCKKHSALPSDWHRFVANGLFRDRGTGFVCRVKAECEFLKQLEV